MFSLGLLASAVIFMIKTITPKTEQYSAVNSRNFLLLFSAFTTGILIFQASHNCQFYFSIFGGVLSVYLYSCAVVTLLLACPLCLTYGEAAILTQAVVLFVFSTVINVYDTWYLIPHQCINLSTSILQVIMLTNISTCIFTFNR